MNRLMDEVRARAKAVVNLPGHGHLEVEEIVQRAMERILANPEAGRWVRQVVEFAAGDLLREEWRAHHVPPPLTEGGTALSGEELVNLREDISYALSTLPPQQARIAVLYGAYGWPLDAIAIREDVALSTAWRRWQEAKTALAEKLGGWRGGSDG